MSASFTFGRPALAAALALAYASFAAAENRPSQLPPVVVTGNPLGQTELAAPASVLAGDALVLRRASSLGETLNGLPGVSSSWFGPNASRPVIRGLDGDRVRVLGNGGGALDASTLSYDHAVPIDPLIVQRIEVLRGPAALLYGGSAIGGVVNALDNRIPREAITSPTGSAELRYGGAEHERGGAAVVEVGNGTLALHADAFGRRTRDLRVPEHVPLEGGEALPSTDRVRNSASRTSGGALGGTLFFDRGQAGVSVDTFDSAYGVVAEPDVRIDMRRHHAAFAGELRDIAGPFRTVKTTLNHTDYQHQEIEGDGAVGTTFSSDGLELRVEAEHAPVGPLRGLVGVQVEDVDFQALGEEAFVPGTRTRKQAAFVVEHLKWAGGTLQAGVRAERVKVESEGDADGSDARFGEATSRSFSLASASVSNLWQFTPAWSLSGGVSRTERAPTSFELFANGVHAATGTYERGDAALRTEQGTNVDVALTWKSGHHHLRAGAYSTRFSRFISLDATGTSVEDGEGDEATSVPEYAFRAVRARLHGFEVEGSYRLLDRGWTLDAGGKVDMARGRNVDTGEALPRIAPLRAALSLDAGWAQWSGRLDVERAAEQKRVPATDRATPGHTLVHLSLSRSLSWGEGQEGLVFLKVTNVGDKLAYNASTIDSVRGLSPLPGRGVKAGVRVTF